MTVFISLIEHGTGGTKDYHSRIQRKWLISGKH